MKPPRCSPRRRIVHRPPLRRPGPSPRGPGGAADDRAGADQDDQAGDRHGPRGADIPDGPHRASSSRRDTHRCNAGSSTRSRFGPGPGRRRDGTGSTGREAADCRRRTGTTGHPRCPGGCGGVGRRTGHRRQPGEPGQGVARSLRVVEGPARRPPVGTVQGSGPHRSRAARSSRGAGLPSSTPSRDDAVARSPPRRQSARHPGAHHVPGEGIGRDPSSTDQIDLDDLEERPTADRDTAGDRVGRPRVEE